MPPKAKKGAAIPAKPTTSTRGRQRTIAKVQRTLLEDLTSLPHFKIYLISILLVLGLLIYSAIIQASSAHSSNSIQNLPIQSQNAANVQSKPRKPPVSRPKPIKPVNPFANAYTGAAPVFPTKKVELTQKLSRAAAVLAKAVETGELAPDLESTVKDEESTGQGGSIAEVKRTLEELKLAMGELGEEDLTGMLNAAYRAN